MGPSLPAAHVVNVPDLLQIRWNRRSTGDHIEQDVPLRAKQHQGHTTDREMHMQEQQQHRHQWEKHRGREAGDHLNDRLQALRPLWRKPDEDPDGQRPRRTDHHGRRRSEERCAKCQNHMHPVFMVDRIVKRQCDQ